MASTMGVRSRWLSDKDTESLTKIIHSFFHKSAIIIVGSRQAEGWATDEHIPDSISTVLDPLPQSWLNSQNDVSKWCNKDITLLPPMIVETVFDLSDLTDNDHLFLDGHQIDRKSKTQIVLERWLIDLDLNSYDNDFNAISEIYTSLIALFRELNSLVSELPAADLVKQQGYKTKVITKILDGSKSISSKGRFGLSRPVLPDKPHLHIVQSKDLQPIVTSIGSLNLSVSFRKNCNFKAVSNERLINIMDESFRYAKPISPDYPAKIDEIDDISKNKNYTRPQKIPRDTESPKNINSDVTGSSIKSDTLNRRASHRSSSLSPSAQLLNNQLNNAVVGFSKNPVHSSATPIPMRKEDSIPSVHFYSIEKNDINKIPSSMGSKFRSSYSRNNSLEGNMLVLNNSTPSSHLMLQNFKSKNRYFPINIDAGNNNYNNNNNNNNNSNPLFLDDDLANFMKMLDSKPDLRISSNSSMVYEESILNFKSLKRNNELFSDSPLKESLMFSRSASASASSFLPSRPPPFLSSDYNTPESKLLQEYNYKSFLNDADLSRLTNVNQYQRTNEYLGSLPIKQKLVLGQSPQKNSLEKYSPFDTGYSNRLRIGSTDSGDYGFNNSRRIRNSRGSLESQALNAPLIVSSYSPNSLASHSVHSVLKASPTSVTTDAMATGINTALDSETEDFSNSGNYTRHQVAHRGSTPPVNKTLQSSVMSRIGSSTGRAQSLLRSISVSASGHPGAISVHSKSRTGSAGSLVGSTQLRNILQNSLRNEGFASSHSNLNKNPKGGEMSPEQLKNISYGQEVFDSDEEYDGRDATGAADQRKNVDSDCTNPKTKVDGKKTKSAKSGTKKNSRGSMSNIIANMKEMQRRNSLISSYTNNSTSAANAHDNYNHLRLARGTRETHHSVILNPEEDEDDQSFEGDDEDEDLLFEMSDMALLK